MAFIEFHLLQNFAPGNLNRDDNNSPKSCIFGGFRRARISSQCLKRQIRLHPEFASAVQKHQGDVATRTKKLAIIIRDFLIDQGKDSSLSQVVAENVLKKVDLKVVSPKEKKNTFKTQYLLYLGNKEVAEVKALALQYFEELTKEKSEDKALLKALKDIFKRDAFAADIAMFGRMVADNTDMNVDAACQVAHAISTNVVQNDSDFFTAVEDGNNADEQGSGMMGTLFFNSACYYRYAQINLESLKRNLGEQTELTQGACIGFLKGMIDSKPTGKQNSFAAQNPVSYVRVVIRDAGSPWSLTNAFSKPIDPNHTEGTDLETASALALQTLLSKLKKMYGDEGFVFDGVSTMLDVPEDQDAIYVNVKQLETQVFDKLTKVLD